MDDASLRLTCLSIAAGFGGDCANTIADAEELFDYVKEGLPEEEAPVFTIFDPGARAD